MGQYCTEKKAESKKKWKWRHKKGVLCAVCCVCCVLCTYVNRREPGHRVMAPPPPHSPQNGGPTEYVMGAALGQRDKLFAAMDQNI